ncbi:MAG: GtrA family protein [bacterium]|nr:GtrA family protein [bacterium]
MRIAALQRRAAVAAFIRYGIVGASNVVLGFLCYAALTRGFPFWRAHYLAANASTFLLVVTWSFYWNKRWSFGNREARHGTQYVKFFTVTVLGLGIEQVMLVAGVGALQVNDLLVKLAALPFIVLWNFSMYRLWAFREKTINDDDEYVRTPASVY